MHKLSDVYDSVIKWSRSDHAPRYLAGLSFIEAIFFPVPPDVMLVPMTLARPRRAYEYAAIAALSSVLGGIVGYLLGYFLFEVAVEPVIDWMGYHHAYQTAVDWSVTWGFWVLLVAGFTPIPYKVFTIAAGTVAMPVLPFIGASALGRSARFFFVAWMVKKSGPWIEPVVLKYLDRVGWYLLLAIILIITMIKVW